LAVLISSLILWTSAATLLPTPTAAHCGGVLDTSYSLSGFAPTVRPVGYSSDDYIYWVPEDEGPGSFSIDEFDDGCRGQPSVRYDVAGGDATPAADFEPDSGRVDSDATGLVPINDDAAEEALEFTMVRLSDPSEAGIGLPYEARLYILDNEGPSRVQFERASYAQKEYLLKMSIHLFRMGPATGTASVHFSVTSPDATPGVDHSAPAGGTVTFASGQRAAAIQFDVKNDSVRENAETLTFTLDSASSTSLGAVKTATLSIQDDDGDHTAPVSRFHHPRRGWTYGREDPRLKEFHVFATDSGGSAVKTAQIALRRNMKNGTCSWWNGSGWTARGCGDHLWKERTGKYRSIRSGETFFYYWLKTLLKPSVGDSGIRDYTAFSRAFDRAGNRESFLEAGRNSNTFDVRPGERTTKT
jgi:hypothetical protein